MSIDPDLLTQLGRLTVNFSALEFALQSIVAVLIGGRGDHTPGWIVATNLPFNRLVQVVDALVRHGFPRREILEELELVLGQVSSAEKARNTIIHSVWLLDDGSDGGISRMKITARKQLQMKPEKITPAEVRSVAASIHEATMATANFAVKIGVIMRVGPTTPRRD